MKATQKGIFKDFFSTIIWILMTIFSILKRTFIFIIHLFFYNNVSLTSDVLSDDITNSNKIEDKSQNQSYNNFQSSSSKFDIYNNNSVSEAEINSIDLSTENGTDSNEESQINEEEEREKLKEELAKEDEGDELQANNNLQKYNNFETKGFSPDHPIKEPSLLVPKESTEEESKLSSEKDESVIVNENDSDEDESYSEYNVKNESEKQKSKPKSSKDEKSYSKAPETIKRQISSISQISHVNRAHSLKTNIKKLKKTISPELLEKRRSAINKLIDSEEEYCRYLNILLDVYRSKVNGIIDKETNDLMFGSIKPLINISMQLSSMFYDELKKGPAEAEISKCFSSFSKIVQTFTPFLLNYKKSISSYKKLLTTNLRFTIVVKKIELANTNLKYTNIYSLPTHQFTNYISLLKEVLKETPQWHTDYQEIPKVIMLLRETNQNIEKQCKDNANENKLKSLENQIYNCPKLLSPGRRYIRSFKLLDWKKLYIFNDMLLITRRRRLRKEVDLVNVKSIWLDSNTGTIHLKIPNKNNAKIRGGLKGNEIYTILKTLIDQKSSDGQSSPPPQTSSHEKFLYRRSDLVRPLSPPSEFLSFDETSINTDTNSNSLANSYFSTSTNETKNTQKSVFIYPNDDNKANNNETENSDDDDDDTYSDSDNNFSEVPEVAGNLEDSDSNESNQGKSNTDNNSKSTNANESPSSSDEKSNEKFSEQMLHDRKAAIDNLATSEQNYQQNLESIVNLYKSKFSKSIIDEKTEQAVFGNVSSLIVLSEQTNLSLRKEIQRGPEKAEIWKCYSLAPQYIKYYHTYITSYTSMLSHYNDFVISDKKIKKFVKKIEGEDPQHRFTSLSLMPFVRINTLIKQLQSILDSTPDWHTDYINLPDTISALTSISKDTDKMLDIAENLNHLIQIETSIIDCPSLFSQNRTFLKSFVLNDKTTIYVLNDIIVFSRPNKKFKYCLSFSDIKKISNKLTNVALTMIDGKTHSIKSSDQTQKIFEFLREQKARQAVSV